MISRQLLTEKVSSCCEVDGFSIDVCSQAERQALAEYFPDSASVIVLAHHVMSSVEWMWFPCASERNHINCAADLHVQGECAKIVSLLKADGHTAIMLPYPGKCGVRFKDMAKKTGLGAMGDNFLFLHRQWGPWIQLRVILTDVEITDTLPHCDEVCTHCGLCQASCPAQAIHHAALAGVECGQYQEARNRETGIPGSYLGKCEVCVRVCPIGDAPTELLVTRMQSVSATS